MNKIIYISPKVTLRDGRIGKSLYATQNIESGEIITDSSNGPLRFISGREARNYPDTIKSFLFQVDTDRYLVYGNPEVRNDADFMNHSCNPNCGIKDTFKIVAMRNIVAGEEITYDYAMNESAYAFTLHCRCGSPRCRQVITGLDWYQKNLQSAYNGYFSDYLQKKLRAPRLLLKYAEIRDCSLRFIKLGILNHPIVARCRNGRLASRKGGVEQ